jgi:isoquinoline 1-oxidoreductase beta subunit
MKAKFSTSRRGFLKTSAAVGGGLAVGIHLPVLAQGSQGSAAAPDAARQINLWVLVAPDDSVVIRYARSEMGQGSLTSAPMLVAEELGCDWNKVRVEYVSANANAVSKRAWGPMNASGSQTIRSSQLYLRRGGATAREMLIAAAAQEWKVPAAECTAANSTIRHAASGRVLSFGQVAEAASRLQPPKDVKLKDPKDWTLLGKSLPRFDIPATVRGKQRYGIDTQLPGMVYAAVAQCPVFGGKVRSMDAAKIQGRRGILKVFDMGDFVAVVADNWWRAKEALKVLPVEWDEGANGKVSSASIMETFKHGLAQNDLPVARNTGNVEQGFASAAKVLEAEYFTPYLNHATLEPMGCTALYKDNKVEVWVSTQNAEASLATAADAAGVPVENVDVHRVQAGGGFGRRGTQDYTRQAVRIAKLMPGVPVKSLWTREEDMQHGFYRPASLVKMKAGLDAGGNPVAWSARIAAPSIIATLLRLPLKDGIDPQAVTGFVDQPYSIPNVKVDYAQRSGHVPVGFWRTVGHSQNPYVRECFMDEMALAAGKDPYHYRRGLLRSQPRDLAVLDAVAKAAGWDTTAPKGVSRGIAEAYAYGSYIASVIEVSSKGKDKSGTDQFAIHRIVVAIDCGYVVNPDNIRAQMEGSVVWALSAILWGDNTIKDGRIEQSNFHDYRMLKIAEMPKVEVVIAPTGGFWGGVGEPANAPIAPALCNAIFAATGKRVRSLPLRHHGLALVKA